MLPAEVNGMTEASVPLDELSLSITQNAAILTQYLEANQLPQPTFERDGPSTIIPSDAPPKIQQARQSLIAAALEMSQLAAGPDDFLPNLATGVRFSS